MHAGQSQLLVERPRVAREAGVPEVEPPVAGERAAGACGPRREHAVEHVHPGLDHLEDPLGVADPHEVARPVGRHLRRRGVGRLEHRRAVLADREAADRVAVEVELGDLLGRPPPQLGVGAALADPEAELALGARRVPLAARPLGGTAHGLGELGARHAGRRDVVEAHGDVAAEVPLDLGRELRREPDRRSVVDAPEGHPVVIDREQRVPQREDLEPARVGQDRRVPAHEAVQPAELRDQAVAGPEVQVVRVPEHDLRPEPLQLGRVERLHRGLRPDRHEHRRPHLAVRGREHACAGGAVGRLDAEAHHRSSIASPKE